MIKIQSKSSPKILYEHAKCCLSLIGAHMISISKSWISVTIENFYNLIAQWQKIGQEPTTSQCRAHNNTPVVIIRPDLSFENRIGGFSRENGKRG